MSLGAMEKGVTVEENVNAFGTFANSGEFVDAYMIDKIVSKMAEVIYQHKAETSGCFLTTSCLLNA